MFDCVTEWCALFIGACPCSGGRSRRGGGVICICLVVRCNSVSLSSSAMTFITIRAARLIKIIWQLALVISRNELMDDAVCFLLIGSYSRALSMIDDIQDLRVSRTCRKFMLCKIFEPRQRLWFDCWGFSCRRLELGLELVCARIGNVIKTQNVTVAELSIELLSFLYSISGQQTRDHHGSVVVSMITQFGLIYVCVSHETQTRRKKRKRIRWLAASIIGSTGFVIILWREVAATTCWTRVPLIFFKFHSLYFLLRAEKKNIFASFYLALSSFLALTGYQRCQNQYEIF